MNVEEYLEATNGSTVEKAEKKSGGDCHSKGSDSDLDLDLEDNLSLNDPDDIQKNLAKFAEINSSLLHGALSEKFGMGIPDGILAIDHYLNSKVHVVFTLT